MKTAPWSPMPPLFSSLHQRVTAPRVIITDDPPGETPFHYPDRRSGSGSYRGIGRELLAKMEAIAERSQGIPCKPSSALGDLQCRLFGNGRL